MKTHNIIIFILLVFIVPMLYYSCNSQGKAIQGEDGRIKSAKIRVRCSPSQKTYTKELEAKLKSELQELDKVPDANFEASLNTKAVKLAQFSSEGLDRDLLLFRICEMVNNRGLSKEQTQELIDSAIEAYEIEVKKNPN